ncbi:superoxide dismutase family protein [Rhodobacteraceae bacterium 2CG4]|uniref:Superoxide dismutase family protein n=1 Tax=Halovulum marinum TaxID=2662447 RepID=A0A6L5Z5P2_9RHOB|nr:superoxide dismutase family protein [Halovulum marinum]MSU91400.1 superoxide dismutase family protein [Halovulum marinum]
MPRLTAATAIVLLLAAPVAAQSPGASAEMTDADGNPVGTVTFTESGHGVLVRAELQGLPEGWHGFHLHQTGSCEPDFAAAGDHYNPADAGHGLLTGGAHHAGDLTNIWVGADGAAKADMFTTDVTLETSGEATLNDDDGTAVIVHENPDSYGEDAGAGGRIACGVVSFGT